MPCYCSQCSVMMLLWYMARCEQMGAVLGVVLMHGLLAHIVRHTVNSTDTLYNKGNILKHGNIGSLRKKGID